MALVWISHDYTSLVGRSLQVILSGCIKWFIRSDKSFYPPRFFYLLGIPLLLLLRRESETNLLKMNTTYYIWSSQKCLAKNRQLNRLKIQQPCLKAAEPSSAALVVLLLVWSGSGNKGNSMLGWLAGCPDIIRFLSGVKINGWGSILTTTFYPLSDCDSEQQFKVLCRI